MERLHHLSQLWSWLPHFRAIAETQHLGKAAALLHVTPPAMSRALQNLESVLGERLFDRRGRSLVLNDAGASLLVAVRHAMRMLEDGVSRVGSAKRPVRVKVSAPGPYYAAVVMPAYARARSRWPELELQLVDSPSSIPIALERGEVDVCLHEHMVAGREITVEKVAEVQKVVAAARTHPAALRRRLSATDLTAYEFVAPPPDPAGIRADGWPAAHPRRVGLTVSNMQLGVDATASGAFLAVLPLPIVTGTELVALRVTFGDGVFGLAARYAKP